MAEEQKWREPGGHRLCTNNCGFFGSPTTHYLCSKCYKDQCMKEQQMPEAKLAVEKTSTLPKSELASSASVSLTSDPLVLKEEAPVVPETAALAVDMSAKANRCAACRRRVGLTGFTCRCGTMFCGSHRYQEQHGCTFDFKSLRKEAIAKVNPVVKAEKLHKI